jgi:hypothetical protein
MVIRTTHEAAVKNSIPKQNRVIVNGRIPLESDRDAICDWAERSDPTLTRSQYAKMRWGRGGFERNVAYTWFPHGWYCKDAGVRLEQGNMVVIENYRRREVRRVPLAEVALEIVKSMYPPDYEKWEIRGWGDLLIYCDYLEEHNHGKIARKLRRWAEEIRDPAPTDATARRKSYRRPSFIYGGK